MGTWWDTPQSPVAGHYLRMNLVSRICPFGLKEPLSYTHISGSGLSRADPLQGKGGVVFQNVVLEGRIKKETRQ